MQYEASKKHYQTITNNSVIGKKINIEPIERLYEPVLIKRIVCLRIFLALFVPDVQTGLFRMDSGFKEIENLAGVDYARIL